MTSSHRPDRVLTVGALSPAEMDAWQALCVRVGSGYFTGPTWATSWYDSFGRGAPSQIGWWGGPDAPEAVAPMVLVDEALLPGRARDVVSVPAWTNLGAGPGGADHLGFPSLEQRREDTVRWAVARSGTVRLANLRGDWELALAREGFRTPQRVRTYAADVREQPRPGSKKLWKHITRSRRQLEARGVDFGCLMGTQLDRAVLEQLFSLHGIRSDRVGRTTTFTSARLDFHQRLAERSTEVHSSFMVAAHLDGELIGALYGFADPTRWHYFQSGWDPAFERASLGSVLIGEAIERSREQGAATFDFLRGDEPYKLRFGAAVHEDLTLLVPRGVPGRLLVSRERLAARAEARRGDVTD